MTSLTAQGFELAVFGMGSVLTFLLLLILVTYSMSWLVLRFEKSIGSANDIQKGSQGSDTPGTSLTKDDARLKAVISIAIRQYRQNEGARK